MTYLKVHLVTIDTSVIESNNLVMLNLERYRPNVAAMIQNTTGKLLLGHRRDNRSQPWQFPQGGIKKGETSVQALAREVAEETGITCFQILRESRRWYVYDWPIPREFLGQRQKYFLVAVDEQQESSLEESKEFSHFKWVEPFQAIHEVAEFKREVYTQVLNDFFKR